MLVQAAIHVGPLRISQPLLVIVDPVLSIYLSVQLYAEHFTDDAVKLTLAALGFVGMCAGVVLLAYGSVEHDSRRGWLSANGVGVPPAGTAVF